MALFHTHLVEKIFISVRHHCSERDLQTKILVFTILNRWHQHHIARLTGNMFNIGLTGQYFSNKKVKSNF